MFKRPICSMSTPNLALVVTPDIQSSQSGGSTQTKNPFFRRSPFSKLFKRNKPAKSLEPLPPIPPLPPIAQHYYPHSRSEPTVSLSQHHVPRRPVPPLDQYHPSSSTSNLELSAQHNNNNKSRVAKNLITTQVGASATTIGGRIPLPRQQEWRQPRQSTEQQRVRAVMPASFPSLGRSSVDLRVPTSLDKVLSEPRPRAMTETNNNSRKLIGKRICKAQKEEVGREEQKMTRSSNNKKLYTERIEGSEKEEEGIKSLPSLGFGNKDGMSIEELFNELERKMGMTADEASRSSILLPSELKSLPPTPRPDQVFGKTRSTAVVDKPINLNNPKTHVDYRSLESSTTSSFSEHSQHQHHEQVENLECAEEQGMSWTDHYLGNHPLTNQSSSIESPVDQHDYSIESSSSNEDDYEDDEDEYEVRIGSRVGISSHLTFVIGCAL